MGFFKVTLKCMGKKLLLTLRYLMNCVEFKIFLKNKKLNNNNETVD